MQQHTSEYEVWIPDRLHPVPIELTEDVGKTIFLSRSVISILNKLTPENFPTLSEKMKTLPIDSSVQMQQVVEIIHQKAIREWKFQALYAKICDLMQNIEVVDESGVVKPFSLYLIAQCEKFFLTSLSLCKGSGFGLQKHEMNLCLDQGIEKSSMTDHEENEGEFCREAVGNCEFIGELFKVYLIHPKIIFLILDQLSKTSGNLAVECKCALLITIGLFYEEKIKKLPEVYFDNLESLLLSGELSSRIRFIIQDALDLKKNSWRPRKLPELPKTFQQIEQDLIEEEKNQKLSESMSRLDYFLKNSVRDDARIAYSPHHTDWTNISALFFNDDIFEAENMQEEIQVDVRSPLISSIRFYYDGSPTKEELEQDVSAQLTDEIVFLEKNQDKVQAEGGVSFTKLEKNLVVRDRKRYTVEFLKSLRELPQCKKSVKVADNLPGSLYSDSGFPNMMRSQSAHHSVPSDNFMMPAFMRAGRSSMKLSTRKSQQGRPKNERQNPIHTTLSLKEDVSLRFSKNDLKPARQNSDIKNLSADEKKTQELYNTVTGILNKLTPENFDLVIEKIKKLPIDNVPRLQGVIDLIFDKAIDEPGLCRWCAEICRVMQHISVPDKVPGKMRTFRILFINKCQQVFENEMAVVLNVIEKQKEIDTCPDMVMKKELESLLEQNKRKAVGNCRLMGELFKLKILTAKVMLRCLTKLMNSVENLSLECLCTLLNVVGKDLKSKLALAQKKEFASYFDKIQDILKNEEYQVSFKVRLMLQDVIDLKNNEWILVPKSNTESMS